MAVDDVVVGIDLGTTNSEVAAFLEGQVRVLGPGDERMLPSCVGLSPAGELLVGRAARNQQILYPDRTVRSVKRRMGSGEPVTLGERTFSPSEISALLLRELAEWARASLGRPVTKAVITVPAFFSDAQRNATREAGALAGLEVLRILNEPTAASLAYGHGDGRRRTILIYDLGGGTFDVSVVVHEDEVTEVLASHGNTRLGGDDFDDLLVERLRAEFQRRHGIDLREGNPVAWSRLWWAAEEAKKRLSFEPHVAIREEALATRGGLPLHLEMEVSREEYEGMIRPLVESTLESVAKALADAGKTPKDLDAVLLVGGSTRTPLVSRVLEERTGIAPRQEIHPDLCVALGAGVLASRLAGHEVERVLVDITPYSFGVSHLGEKDGEEYVWCYHPLLRRNTPLPITRAESYWTSYPGQTEVHVHVFQGDDPDALKNIPVGEFHVEGLSTTEEPNEVICRMALDIDGILQVTATEKRTGLSKRITIANALAKMEGASLEEARARIAALYASRAEDEEEPEEGLEDEDEEGLAAVPLPGGGSIARDEAAPADEGWARAERDGRELLRRARALLEAMHPDDREETVSLNERVEVALERRDGKGLEEAVRELREILFFVEGKR